MPDVEIDLTPSISQGFVLGNYYAWRGGQGRRDDYSRRIVSYKNGEQDAIDFFSGKVSRFIIGNPRLNRASNVLIPVPRSRAHNPTRPHRGELLCQAVAATPGVLVSYGNYVRRHTSIRPSHAQTVSGRPSVEEHVESMAVQIPRQTGGTASKLGRNNWRSLGAILFDDVRFFGATSEACARLLLRAGFSRVDAIYLGQNQR